MQSSTEFCIFDNPIDSPVSPFTAGRDPKPFQECPPMQDLNETKQRLQDGESVLHSNCVKKTALMKTFTGLRSEAREAKAEAQGLKPLLQL